MLDQIKEELKKGGKTILEILMKNGSINAKKFSELTGEIERTKKTALELLVERKVVSEETLAGAYAQFLNIPYTDLHKQKLNREALYVLDRQLSEKNRMVVFNSDKLSYQVAIANPFNLDAWQELEVIDQKDDKDVDLYLCSNESINYALKEYDRYLKSPEGQVAKIFVDEENEKLQQPAPQPEKIALPIITEPPLPTPPPVPNAPKVKADAAPATAVPIKITKTEAKKEPVQPVEKEQKPVKKVEGDIEYEIVKPETSAEVEEEKVALAEEDVENETQAEQPVPVPPTGPAATGADMDISELAEESLMSPEELQAVIKTASIPKAVGAIIRTAINMHASDVHIEPETSDLRVRFRLDGILKEVLHMPKEYLQAIVARVKILSKLKIDETRIPQDGAFRISFDNRLIDLRVSTFPTVQNGEKLAIRILDKGTTILTLEGVGMRGTSLERVKDNILKPHGIILVTGPTGSGKSTTLYSILGILNKPEVNIITIEDPVEYSIEGINQCQVNPKIGLTFAEGFRSVLRQDPNIVMVGEIRDGETAELAVQAALTGHLILATLHTNDATSAIPRLIDMNVEPFLITSSLNCVLAQRLVRKICPDCRQEVKLPPEVFTAIKQEIASITSAEGKKYTVDENTKMFTGAGCSKCNNTGYKGRVGLFEVMSMSDEIEKMAVAREPSSHMRDQAIKEGMITLKQDGALKVLDGITSWDEVLRVTKE